ncbi:MAG: 23S rRNA (adenine(2503)-C(2))-methyltransferase RlmN [Terriglobia bacterium]
MQETRTNLIGLERENLEGLAIECGEPRYRGRQLFRGVYGRRELSFERFSDLPKRFREQLARRWRIDYPDVREKHPSSDGSARYLLSLEDGNAVEAVYMPEAARVTLCLSSQAGCAVDCRFCFTGLMNLVRNLTAGEILGQVFAIARDQGFGSRLRLNVVFMGMGEPLLNFGPVMKAVRVLCNPDGFAIPWRRITLSTSGIIPGIRELAGEPVRPKLAVSLNASTNEQRVEIMPISRKYPLADLIEACRAYPLRPREKLTFEYVLLGGVNDSRDDALRVAVLLRGLRAKVNVIPYNSGPELPYRAPPFERVLEFREALNERDVDSFIRVSRGQDVRAACGQLMLKEIRQEAG